jgi:hypothetical protein
MNDDSRPRLHEIARSLTIGKLRWSRVRFQALLEKYREPVAQLKSERPGTDVTYDAYGHPRVISNFNHGGLSEAIFSGTPDEELTFMKEFACGYLKRQLSLDVLDAADISLSFAGFVSVPNVEGGIVVFAERIKAISAETVGTTFDLDVDKSQLQVLVRKAEDGAFEICSLTSSLSRVPERKQVEFAITESQAKVKAERAMRYKLGDFEAGITVVSCLKQANKYRGKPEPIYRLELRLDAEQEKLPVPVIVRADNGKVVFAQPQILRAFDKPATGAGPKDAPQGNIPGKALLNEPNRYQAIAAQFKDMLIDRSILRVVDGKPVLANSMIEVRACELDEDGRRSTSLVTTMPEDGTADGGTFNWPENTPQAKAVVVYVASMFLINLAIECGLKIPEGSKVLLLIAGDVWNVDNDTFYPPPDGPMIQDGVGDGSLFRKDMVYDLVPDDHELTHWIVYLLRTLDHYIQGNLGAALNEAIADIVATVVRYLAWFRFGIKLGDQISYDKLMNDLAIIGYYLMVNSANGYRQDNNNFVYPDDLHGTNVHDNCRIPAAAMLHTFFAMLDNAISVLQAAQIAQGIQPMSKDQALQFVLEKTIKDFLRLVLTAIPLLPAHDVTFSDGRKALEDADNLLFRGTHKDFIAKGFDRHKIKTNLVVLSRFTAYR